MTPPTTQPSANNLDAFLMPFTANRQFKAAPRLLAAAKGMHYWTPDGRRILDGTAGLWCVNAGHGREQIKAAIARAARGAWTTRRRSRWATRSRSSSRQRLAAMLPGDLNHVFFCNSGSEAVDTALKIALAYQRRAARARAAPHRPRARLSRRRLRRHLGRRHCQQPQAVRHMLPGVDHLPHTHDLAQNAFSRGQPEQGAHLADELERLVALHDASTIAAVIVEPCAGSTGVLPPPKGYLQRLREICDKHGILLIFDEVITGFGRLGATFAAEYFGVIPDLMTRRQGHHQRRPCRWAACSCASTSTTR